MADQTVVYEFEIKLCNIKKMEQTSYKTCSLRLIIFF